jgi:arylsulfatase A-like enzyme
MQGVDQLPVWQGVRPSARDHVFAENRNQPTSGHIRTYIDERYKLTVYRDQPWGELFDLEADPAEHRNLFDNPDYEDLRAEVMRRFVNAELRREASKYERIAVA